MPGPVGALEGGNPSRPEQRLIRRLFLGIIIAAGPVLSCAAANVTLAWNPSSDPIVAGYNIYYGGASGVYTNVIDAGGSTGVTISNLASGNTYYFASTTYSAAGAVSALSAEVAYTVPAAPLVRPPNLPPTLNPIGNLIVNASAGTQTVSLTGISSGSTAENQILTVTATSSDTNLVSGLAVNYTSPNDSGSLTFSPVANASGSATVTVMVNDGGSTSNLIARSFAVIVGRVTEQLRQAPGGQMVLTVTGPVGSNYVIQTSTDLVHWTPFSTNAIPPGGSVQITDANPGSPQKFYRAAPYIVSVPPPVQQSGFKLSNGVLTFTLSGPVGNTYVMQWSTNLVAWTPFATNTISPGGSVQVIDPHPTVPQKFYRAVPYVVSVAPPPQLSGSRLSGGFFTFTFSGVAGHTYEIQTTQDFAAWTVIGTLTADAGGWQNFTDTNSAGFSRRFYRIRDTQP